MAFEETLVELEVGSLISDWYNSFVLEFLVPVEQRFQPDKPRSPDYGITLPDTQVLVEVTVWHWEARAAWERTREAVYQTMQLRLQKRGASGRDVHIELPLGATPNVREIIVHRDVVNRIAEDEAGSMTFEVGARRPAELTWRTVPLLHFADRDSIDWKLVAATGAAGFTTGPVPPEDLVGHTFRVSADPCITEEDLEGGFNSLRRVDRSETTSSQRPARSSST